MAWSSAAVLLTGAAVFGVTALHGHQVGQQQAAVTTAAEPTQLTCWNDQNAPPGQCTRPIGRAGLSTVFPSLTSACLAGPAPRRGAIEAFVCKDDDYVIRYTRWQAGFDRFGVYDRLNDAQGTRWTVGGQFAGRTWSSDDRWAATYRGDPYSADVSADNATALRAGIAAIHAVRPGKIGRR